jgi:hypothetical protein
MGKLLSLAGLLAGICLLFCGFVFGQEPGVMGTIKDGTGSAIAGAKVTLTNVLTKASESVVSNESGIYSASNLSSGSYSVTASKEGFESDSRNVIEVRPGHAAVADLSLKMLAAGNPVRDEFFLQLTPGVTGDTFSGGTKGPQIAESDREDDDFLQLSPGIAGQGFSSGVRCGFHPWVYMGFEGAESEPTGSNLSKQPQPATLNTSPAQPSGGPEVVGTQSHDETFLQLAPGVTGNAFSGWNNAGPAQIRDSDLVSGAPPQGANEKPKAEQNGSKGPSKSAINPARDESFLQLSPGVIGNAFSGWTNSGSDPSQEAFSLNPGSPGGVEAKIGLFIADSAPKKWFQGNKWLDAWLVIGLD